MHQAAAKQTEWFEDTLDKLSAGICILDREQQVVWVNKTLRDYLNVHEQQLIGKTKKEMLCLAGMVPQEMPANLLEAQLATTDVEARHHVEYRLAATHDRPERWLQMSSSPIQVGRFRGGHAEHYADITAQKRSERAVHDTLRDVIKAIGMTIQYKDPYTALHQQRVAHLARAIAEELRLEQQQVEAIHTAAAVHDVGKIGIPGEILSKPTRLGEHEFNLIKEHPHIGYNILKDLEFPWDIAGIVLQHHERMNGSGYPRGLIGEEIMIEARVLAVADVVESMGANRPYRPALGIDKALEEITAGRQTLYCPAAVDACVRLFSDKGYTFP